MAPSFLSLPAEIRLQIYRLLLHDIEFLFDIELRRGNLGCGYNEIDWDDTSIIIFKDKPQVEEESEDEEEDEESEDEEEDEDEVPSVAHSYYTGILSTCRQIYNEAVVVLYEENIFSYHPRLRTLQSIQSTTPVAFPANKLQMLRILRFVVHQHTLIQHPKRIVELLDHFSACSLKYVALQFTFMQYEDILDYMCFARDTTIAQTLSKLKISEEIQIEVYDPVRLVGQHYEQVVTLMAKAKGWGCSAKFEENANRYIACVDDPNYWLWSLRPTGILPAQSAPCQAQELEPLASINVEYPGRFYQQWDHLREIFMKARAYVPLHSSTHLIDADLERESEARDELEIDRRREARLQKEARRKAIISEQS